jgi:hypothetical protein
MYHPCIKSLHLSGSYAVTMAPRRCGGSSSSSEIKKPDGECCRPCSGCSAAAGRQLRCAGRRDCPPCSSCMASHLTPECEHRIHCQTRLAQTAQRPMLVTGGTCISYAPSRCVSVRYQQRYCTPDLQRCCQMPCRMSHHDVPPWRRSQVLACGSRCLAEGGGVGLFLSCRRPKAACHHQQPTPAQGRRGVASAAGDNLHGAA